MTARRIGEALSYPAAAAALLLLAPVSGPAPTMGFAAGAALGAAAGTCLFALLACELPPGAIGFAAARRSAALLPAICLAATSEEIVWRWAVLRGLAPPLGADGAAAVAVAGFAARHARGLNPRPLVVHLGTSGCFTALALLTGRVSSAAFAHVAYNLLVVGSTVRLPAAAKR